MLWLRYLEPDSGVEFPAIAGFIESHPAWPLPVTLALRAEAVLDPETPPEDVAAWFTRHAPVSGKGMVHLARALAALGRDAEARTWALSAWTGATLDEATEAELLAQFGQGFTQADHALRLDTMIWEGLAGQARRVLGLVDAGPRSVGNARIALMQRQGGVDQAIAAVPPALLAEPGLVFERVRWRRRAGNTDGAIALLLAPPAELGRPGPWWTERNILSRQSLDLGHITDAYRLSRDHGQSDRGKIAAAEWLAGWIALTMLGEPESAYWHFTRQHANVRYPISLARAGYWAGRAAADMGEAAVSQSWYREAARYHTTYYGQLAAEAMRERQPVDLPRDPVPAPADVARFAARELVPIVLALAEVEEQARLRPFILRLAGQAESTSELLLVARLAESVGRPDLGVAVAKRSFLEGTMLASANYPLVTPTGAAEPALVLAVARQESEFNAAAISPAGARGLMQLMPATARIVAQSLHLGYDRQRLTEDPQYNVRLGSAHLGELIDNFDGSYLLAVTAYNAGAARVGDWLRTYGDPRSGTVDAIDWVETIPFPETRNYVQRVFENLQVYRSVLAGRPTGITLIADLTR